VYFSCRLVHSGNFKQYRRADLIPCRVVHRENGLCFYEIKISLSVHIMPGNCFIFLTVENPTGKRNSLLVSSVSKNLEKNLTHMKFLEKIVIYMFR
jgi:hypothetical protein